MEQVLVEANNMTGPRARSSDSQYPGGHLKGKVALIVTDTLKVIHTLAVGLAERGAEITVVGPSREWGYAAGIQDGVEDLGRRFLFIPQQNSSLNAERIVRQVLAVFGQLDIFIDFSRSPAPIADWSTAREASEVVGEQIFSNPDLVTAAMRTIARK